MKWKYRQGRAIQTNGNYYEGYQVTAARRNEGKADTFGTDLVYQMRDVYLTML